MTAEPHASWIAVLDRMEQKLAASLQRTDQQGPPSPAERTSDWNPLAALDEHLGRFQRRLDAAAASAAETDGLLASAAGDLRTWLEALARTSSLADKVAGEKADETTAAGAVTN